MSEFLTYSEQFLKEKNGYWTAKEICQQPQVWQQAALNVEQIRATLSQWLTPILAQTNLRIILTGAGTSAYVGEAITPALTQHTQRVFEAISTTDIVSNPQQYLLKEKPTLIISFGRSGNSPESVAAIRLADQVIDNCFHLVITCNPEGELAINAKNNINAFSLIMPEGTLDQSFAMTSSYTSMMVTTLAIFSPDLTQLNTAIQWSENFITNKIQSIKKQAQLSTKRLVFLGSGGLQGIAQEAALKVLELTAGDILSYYESPLGFRHGPKSLIDNSTEIIMLCSSNKYTQGYEKDLYAELINDNQALMVTQINKEIFDGINEIDDVWAGLPYILYCQILAFFKSINLNITPDNPCPTGEVNRVVQGVTIYPLSM